MTDSEIVPTLNTIIGEVEALRKRNDRQLKMIEGLQEQNRNQKDTLDRYRANIKNLDSTIGLLRGQLLGSRQNVEDLQREIVQPKNPKPEYVWILRAHLCGCEMYEQYSSKTPFTAEVILGWQKKGYECKITYEAAF